MARFDNQEPNRRGVQHRNIALEHTFCYLFELALLNYGLVSEQPRWVAAAALYLSKATMALARVCQGGRDAL